MIKIQTDFSLETMKFEDTGTTFRLLKRGEKPINHESNIQQNTLLK